MCVPLRCVCVSCIRSGDGQQGRAGIVKMCESGLREWKEVQISIWELKQNSENRVLSSEVQVQI